MNLNLFIQSRNSSGFVSSILIPPLSKDVKDRGNENEALTSPSYILSSQLSANICYNLFILQKSPGKVFKDKSFLNRQGRVPCGWFQAI